MVIAGEGEGTKLRLVVHVQNPFLFLIKKPFIPSLDICIVYYELEEGLNSACAKYAYE